MLENLHFIRPLWLLALMPLALLAWRVFHSGIDNPWQRVVDARLLPLMTVGHARKTNRSVLWLLASGWIVTSLALADPTWERKPQPIFKSDAARVVVLDLSSSMSAGDVKPSRLARARYKVEDVLSLGAEGQSGLVVYAANAFAVTPLTRDANTIRSQLNALSPDLMPRDGSRADLGLLKAGELMRHAGLSSGQVLLVADGVAPGELAATQQAAAHLEADGFRVSVLVVGPAGRAADPVQEPSRPERGNQGTAPSVDADNLRSVADAGGGIELPVDGGIVALRRWVDSNASTPMTDTAESRLTAQAWKEEGPLLVLLLLPLAALAFRRNWLLSLMLLPLLGLQPHEAMAATWSDLWQRPEQQAAAALSAGNYAAAARLAGDADRRGSAEYKRGDYPRALQNFSQATGPQASYNRGNALAKLGRYPEAISAYEQALKVDPKDADARANKAAVEALLKQQQAKADQDKAGPPKSSPEAAGQQGDAKPGSPGAGKRQDASAGNQQEGGSGSGQGKEGGKGGHDDAGKQAGKDGRGKGSQPGATPDPKSTSAGKASPSPQAGESPGAPASAAAGKPGADAAGASDRAVGAHDDKAPDSPWAAAKPGSEFADAAQKLANQGPASRPDKDVPAGSSAGASSEAAPPGARNRKPVNGPSSNAAQPLPTEEQAAAEQWLRRIPDDPGSLLRRKFLYQYRQQAQLAPADDR